MMKLKAPLSCSTREFRLSPRSGNFHPTLRALTAIETSFSRTNRGANTIYTNVPSQKVRDLVSLVYKYVKELAASDLVLNTRWTETKIGVTTKFSIIANPTALEASLLALNKGFLTVSRTRSTFFYDDNCYFIHFCKEQNWHNNKINQIIWNQSELKFSRATWESFESIWPFWTVRLSFFKNRVRAILEFLKG